MAGVDLLVIDVLARLLAPLAIWASASVTLVNVMDWHRERRAFRAAEAHARRMLTIHDCNYEACTRY